MRKGRVSGLVCRRIRLGEPDSSGRRAPVDTGEEVILEVDMVIKATGQMPYEELMTTGVVRGRMERA